MTPLLMASLEGILGAKVWDGGGCHCFQANQRKLDQPWGSFAEFRCSVVLVALHLEAFEACR